MPLRKTGQGRSENRKVLKGPPALRAFSGALTNAIDGVEINLDEPGDEAGEWWIDISAGKFQTTLSWRSGHGFGVFTSEGDYGARPDELYQTPDRAAHRVEQLHDHWLASETIEPLWLADVRDLAGQQQAAMAEALECNQPNVSRLENRFDAKLSTIARYIEAMGGALELRVHFKDWQAVIVMPEEPSPPPKASRR